MCVRASRTDAVFFFSSCGAGQHDQLAASIRPARDASKKKEKKLCITATENRRRAAADDSGGGGSYVASCVAKTVFGSVSVRDVSTASSLATCEPFPPSSPPFVHRARRNISKGRRRPCARYLLRADRWDFNEESVKKKKTDAPSEVRNGARSVLKNNVCTIFSIVNTVWKRHRGVGHRKTIWGFRELAHYSVRCKIVFIARVYCARNDLRE